MIGIKHNIQPPEYTATIQPTELKQMKQHFGWGRVCRGGVGSPTFLGTKFARG